MKSETLLLDEPLAAGEYKSIRLIVDAVEGERDSYIVLDAGGGEHELQVPSGSTSGFKLDGSFTVVAGQSVNFTIDFDVRKSIVRTGTPKNPDTVKYLLKPVLRIVQNDSAGHITGKVAPALLDDASCSDTDPATFNSVYVFSGAGVTPDDIDGDGGDPLTPSLVTLDTESGDYRYEVGFLPEGEYTIAFTCNVDAEITDVENGHVDNDLKFTGIQDVQVTAGQTAEADFQ